MWCFHLDILAILKYWGGFEGLRTLILDMFIGLIYFLPMLNTVPKLVLPWPTILNYVSKVLAIILDIFIFSTIFVQFTQTLWSLKDMRYIFSELLFEKRANEEEGNEEEKSQLLYFLYFPFK